MSAAGQDRGGQTDADATKQCWRAILTALRSAKQSKLICKGFSFLPCSLSPQSLCYGLEPVTTSRPFFLPGCCAVLSAGLFLPYQRVCKLDFSLTAPIWPDLPLINKQNFQLVYLKLFSAAPSVVICIAANCKLQPQREPRVMGCQRRCPSSLLVGAEAWLQCLSCMHRYCYFSTLLSLLASTYVSADGNSCFPVVGIRESYAEVATSSYYHIELFHRSPKSIQWEGEFIAGSESAGR